jgi:hypothetical protein
LLFGVNLKVETYIELISSTLEAILEGLFLPTVPFIVAALTEPSKAVLSQKPSILASL